MNAKLWAESTQPQAMLEYLRGKASERKLRLFSVAACRRLAHLNMLEPGLNEAIEVADRFADGNATEEEITWHFDHCCTREEALHGSDESARVAAYAVARVCSPPNFERHDPSHLAQSIAEAVTAWGAEHEDDPEELLAHERALQAKLIRCMIGNPFAPATIDPACLTPTVKAVALAAYQERDLVTGDLQLDRVGILADALEDAGVGGPVIEHLRQHGPHVRGCHVVDACLGRS